MLDAIELDPSPYSVPDFFMNELDFDGSGTIDFTDFLGFAVAFGTSDSAYDINENGQVDFADFLIFAQNFGRIVN